MSTHIIKQCVVSFITRAPELALTALAIALFIKGRTTDALLALAVARLWAIEAALDDLADDKSQQRQGFTL